MSNLANRINLSFLVYATAPFISALYLLSQEGDAPRGPQESGPSLGLERQRPPAIGCRGRSLASTRGALRPAPRSLTKRLDIDKPSAENPRAAIVAHGRRGQSPGTHRKPAKTLPPGGIVKKMRNTCTSGGCPHGPMENHARRCSRAAWNYVARSCFYKKIERRCASYPDGDRRRATGSITNSRNDRKMKDRKMVAILRPVTSECLTRRRGDAEQSPPDFINSRTVRANDFTRWRPRGSISPRLRASA